MKLEFTGERVLAVMAHPDDAELLCAGTLARARADGAAIGIAVMCRGDKGVGSVTEKPGDLDRIRQQEATAAAAVLGATLFAVGNGDGELFDTVETRKNVVAIYREFRPTLVIAHSPDDYHVDHRAASEVAEAASWSSASRGHVSGSDPLQTQPKLWFADTINMSSFSPEFFVDVSDQLDVKKRMLACHRSQIARDKDADFFPLSELMLRQCTTRGAEAGVGAAEAFRWHHAFKRLGAF
jgi:LmbE family N-acetylglucosaminyl deacetylase